MSRLSDILLRVRDTLADSSATAWTDPRLIRLVDEGQKDIAEKTRILKAQFSLPIEVGRRIYKIPTSVHRLLRVSVAGKPLEFISKERLDLTSPAWAQKDGTITHIVYDVQSTDNITVYPTPESTSIPGTPETVEMAQVFGVVTNIEVTSFVDEVFVHGEFGLTASIADDTELMVFDYVKTPDTLIDINSAMEINEKFDRALKYFVTSQAFLDDISESNRSKGAEQFSFYNKLVAEAMDFSISNRTESIYRRAIYDPLGS